MYFQTLLFNGGSCKGVISLMTADGHQQDLLESFSHEDSCIARRRMWNEVGICDSLRHV
jgi:hypothetical protein